MREELRAMREQNTQMVAELRRLHKENAELKSQLAVGGLDPRHRRKREEIDPDTPVTPRREVLALEAMESPLRLLEPESKRERSERDVPPALQPSSSHVE
jgi:hypothetical protein